MKIVHAVGWYPPHSLGGTEVYVAALARHLRDAGHQVMVAVPDATLAAERLSIHDGVPVYRYAVPAAPTRAEAQGLAVARGAERFHAWLAAERPDVVHVHSFVTGLGLREIEAARRAGARLFATAHSGGLGWLCQRGTLMRGGAEPCEGGASPAACTACVLALRLPKPLARGLAAIPPAAGRLARALPGRAGTALAMTDLIARNQAAQRALLAAVERFVVLAEWARRALIASGAPRAKLFVSRLGVASAAVPKPGPDVRPTARPVRIAYVGRFARIKGVHDLVRAVTSLPRDVPLAVELRGPAAGDDERRYLAELRALAAGDPRIAFAPPVAHGDAPRVLASADVLCCPSLTLEGGPTVALEAHAVGTPVIGSGAGGLAELVEDGVSGRLVRAGDWPALAAVLCEVARHPETVDRWRRRLPRPRTMADVAREHLEMYAA